jgi:hypothetical protein
MNAANLTSCYDYYIGLTQKEKVLSFILPQQVGSSAIHRNEIASALSEPSNNA